MTGCSDHIEHQPTSCEDFPANRNRHRIVAIVACGDPNVFPYLSTLADHVVVLDEYPTEDPVETFPLKSYDLDMIMPIELIIDDPCPQEYGLNKAEHLFIQIMHGMIRCRSPTFQTIMTSRRISPDS